ISQRFWQANDAAGSAPAARLGPSREGSQLGLLNWPACLRRPFRSYSSVQMTLSPALSDRMTAGSRAVAWTNTSFEPSSGEMNPNPLAPLRNLTVPEILMVGSP